MLGRAYTEGKAYALVHSDDINISVKESITKDDTTDTTCREVN